MFGIFALALFPMGQFTVGRRALVNSPAYFIFRVAVVHQSDGDFVFRHTIPIEIVIVLNILQMFSIGPFHAANSGAQTMLILFDNCFASFLTISRDFAQSLRLVNIIFLFMSILPSKHSLSFDSLPCVQKVLLDPQLAA